MKNVLITGGSGGIGLELAKKFGQAGYNLILVSKPLDELQAAQQTLKSLFPNLEVSIFQKDLTEPNAAKDVFQMTQTHNWTIDVLVNNAGFGTYGFMNDIDLEREVNMIELNILAVYKLTRLYLKEMVQRDEGKILNVSSISAFQPNPLLTTYGATKSFVMNFSRGLNYELKQKGSKVRVTTVCPTPVRTGFQKGANMENSKLFDSWMRVSAERVAKDGFDALMRDQEMIVPKKRFHWLNKLTRRLPTSLIMRISANELKSK